MADDGLFGSAVSKADEWVDALADHLGTGRADAYKALRGTLHVLRDRLPVEEATDLGAQLPLLLKGVFYDGYDPSGKPERLDETSFVSRVHAQFGNDPDVDPKAVVQHVLVFLGARITRGQAEHLKASLPADVESLWS